MTGVEASNPIEPVALFKMEMGNAIHNTVNDLMNRALADEYEGEFEIIGAEKDGAEEAFIWEADGLKLPVSGRMDKLVKVQGKTIVFEWKSTYMSGVKYIQQNGAKVDNLMQGIAYLEQDVIPVDALVLMYIARDTGYLYGFYIEKEGDHLLVHHMNSEVTNVVNLNWDMIKESLKDIEDHIDSKTLPERDYEAFVNLKLDKLMGKSDWHCRYCSYRGLCWGCAG